MTGSDSPTYITPKKLDCRLAALVSRRALVDGRERGAERQALTQPDHDGRRDQDRQGLGCQGKGKQSDAAEQKDAARYERVLIGNAAFEELAGNRGDDEDEYD
jgi:hypothetical protein